jgi:N6-adenosine-specific RNA methylase IME4
MTKWNGKYKVIYADPPWAYNDRKMSKQGGVNTHYPTMKMDDLMNLNVKDITDDDCILFLWVTFPFLEDSFKLIEAWGFTYKTIGFNWVKKNKKSDSLFWGLGNWTRSNSELCLLCVKGKPKRVAKNVHSVIMSKVESHSKKPDETKDRIIALCGNVPRIELFARQKTKGWHVWGNEVESDIVL